MIKVQKKIIAFFSAFSFFCHPGRSGIRCIRPYQLGQFPLTSLPPQAAAARLCAAHYPAIPISREEIVNVSGAGDRYILTALSSPAACERALIGFV